MTGAAAESSTAGRLGEIARTGYSLEGIVLGWHTGGVLIDWTGEFGRWLDEVEKRGGAPLTWALALLAELQDLPGPPTQESATFKRVRQARRHPLWRLAHPFDPDTAIRIIVWFPAPDQVVIALVGFDKARHGDVWYTSAAIRAEAMVDQWLREQGRS